MGNAANIKSKLSALRKLQSKHPLLFVHIADCHLKLGKFGAAQRVLKKGIANYPDYPAGWVVEGQYFLLHNQPEKARESFKKVIELDPFNGYAHERCSEIAADFNDHNDYRFHIKAMSKLDPLDDNIQKMRQAEELRQIAVNNGIFTYEEAEGRHTGALRQALLEQKILPVELSRTIDRELSTVQFDESEISDDSDDDEQVVVEFDTETTIESQMPTEPQSEEVSSEEFSTPDFALADEQVAPIEKLDDIGEIIDETSEEDGTANWFDDSADESVEQSAESVPDNQEDSIPENDLTNWAPEEISDEPEESATGVDWSETVTEEEPSIDTLISEPEVELEIETSSEDDEIYEEQSEDDLNIEFDNDPSSEVATVSEEDEINDDSAAKPKTFAEFQALQQSDDQGAETEDDSTDLMIEEIIEEIDQPAKPVFDIKSLGITEDFKDDIDDIFADEDVDEPPAEDTLTIPSEEDEVVSLKSMTEDNIDDETHEMLSSDQSIQPDESLISAPVTEDVQASKSEDFTQEFARDQVQNLSQEPESTDSNVDIPIISGLEGSSAIVEEEDEINPLPEQPPVEPLVVEGLESNADTVIDTEPEITKGKTRQQPQIESAMSQIIGTDEPDEDVPDDVVPSMQAAAAAEPIIDIEPVSKLKSVLELEPEPVQDSMPEPLPTQEPDMTMDGQDESDSGSMLPPLSTDKSSADEEIKKQLKKIAEEVTGVEPVSPERNDTVGSTASAPAPASEPDLQKSKRIATKTLAELYASQWDWNRSISVYEELLGRHPDNDAYKQRLIVLRAKLN